MNFMAAILLLSAMSTGEDARRPACNAANQGRFWPEEANASARAARQLYQNGELLMCSQALWKYKWERLSVNAHKQAKPKRVAGH